MFLHVVGGFWRWRGIGATTRAVASPVARKRGPINFMAVESAKIEKKVTRCR